MVNTRMLSKAEVLMVLFNNSKIQGFNLQAVQMGLMDNPKDIDQYEAQKILDTTFKPFGDIYFDYLNGKVMKVNLTSDEEFDERLYDRDNGEGLAQRAINLYIKERKNVEIDPEFDTLLDKMIKDCGIGSK